MAVLDGEIVAIRQARRDRCGQHCVVGTFAQAHPQFCRILPADAGQA
jgi:hypothetical protein